MRTEYDEEMLNQIAQNVDLLQYASANMDFRKRGPEYFAHCPLHIDKTPSLSISEGVNKYYCFSCGRGGNIINFLMDFEGLRFDEAVEKASKLAHIDLSKMCLSDTIRYLKKIRSWANRRREPYEHTVIPESEYGHYVPGAVQEPLCIL